MALSIEGFIYPTGELQPLFFKGEDLDVLLTAWISQAEDKVVGLDPSVQDIAGSAWVYYRAYSAIAKRIGANPTRESMGGNSGGGVQTTIDWGQNKSEYWEDLAAKALADFEFYVPPVPPVNDYPPVYFGTAKGGRGR